MAIQDNVSIIQTSQGSGSGGWVNYNIFTQLEEPEIKEGIWIQTNQVYQSITTDKNILNEGGEWGSVMTDLPYNFYYGSAVVYNGEIHILGSYSLNCYTKHYKWNGSSWTSVSTLPYDFYYGSAIVYNGEIHILGSYSSTCSTKHYKWNGSTWTRVSTLPYNFHGGSAVVYNGENIYILGSSSNRRSYSAFTSPEKLFNPYTLIIQRGNTSSGVYQACLVNTFDDIVGENNRLLTGFDDIWYFLETKLDTSSPVYYGDGTKWIKLKN